MAKKKKTQLKPVARGFATTSVPKKVIPQEVPDVADAPEDILNNEVKVDRPGDSDDAIPPDQKDEFDTDKAEEQSLQLLVDKLQDKTEKEITRCAYVIPQNNCTN